MEGSYDVFFGNEKIGRIQLRRQGLYYHYTCRCARFTESMYDVYCGSQRLGLLIPKDGQLILDGKLPVKKLEQGSASFLVKPKHAPMSEHFVPLCPQEPFSYLRNLQSAYLETRGGQLGVVMKNEK